VLSIFILFTLLGPLIEPPEITQIQELALSRSHLLGHSLQESEARVLAEAVFEEHGAVSIPMLLAVIEIESKYERKAKSTKNCKGFMQLSHGTAKTMAKRLGMSTFNILKTQDNIKLGAGYLNALLQENRTIGKALTIYNRGWKGFVRNDRKVSGYAKAVIHRAKKIKKLLTKPQE
jgi:hypothetical protein